MESLPAPALRRACKRRWMPWGLGLLAPLLLPYVGALAQPSPAGATAEAALWAEVRDSQKAGDLQAYLDAFPAGTYAPLARRRLQALGPAPSGAPPAAAAPAMPRADQPAAVRVPAQECDRLAEPRRVALGGADPSFGPGLRGTQVDAAPARAACARAMAEHPGEARFIAYAVRAAEAADDKPEAVRLYRLAAERGNAFAQYVMGDTLLSGDLGVEKDAGGGMHWLRLAAGQGVPVAQAELGAVLVFGADGVATDPKEDVPLLRLAAAAGDDGAQNNLGRLAVNGQAGVPQDYVEGARWYRLAMEGGSADAPANLGELYANGSGVAWDDAEAVRLFRIGVERGSADAQNSLGTMHEDGRGGLAKDDKGAARLFRLSADGGDAGGQYNLGRMVQAGRGGLVADPAEALRLYRLAAAQGNVQAPDEVKRLEAELQARPRQ